MYILLFNTLSFQPLKPLLMPKKKIAELVSEKSEALRSQIN